MRLKIDSSGSFRRSMNSWGPDTEISREVSAGMETAMSSTLMVASFSDTVFTVMSIVFVSSLPVMTAKKASSPPQRVTEVSSSNS